MSVSGVSPLFGGDYGTARRPVKRQRDVIRELMLAGEDIWLTLREVAHLTGYGEASISALLRQLDANDCKLEKRQTDRTSDRALPTVGMGHRVVWEYHLSIRR